MGILNFVLDFLVQVEPPSFSGGPIIPPVSEDNKDFNIWYIVGSFATAISALFALSVWLIRVVFNEKDSALNREINKSKEDDLRLQGRELAIKELLSTNTHTLTNICDDVADIKEQDGIIKEKLDRINASINDGFSRVALEIERTKKR